MLTSKAKSLLAKEVIRKLSYRDDEVHAELYLDCKCPSGFHFIEQFVQGLPREVIMANSNSESKFIQRFTVSVDDLGGYTNFRCKAVQQGRMQCPYGNKCPYAEALRYKAADLLPPDKRGFVYTDALEDLHAMIGLASVKQEINQWADFLQVTAERSRRHMNDEPISLHMQFVGNPGTGKTTVARILTDILFGLGLTSKRKIVEVERSDLVAGYVGQTATKTKKKIKEALGGVLFIDEAYSLARGEYYGRESIDTIVKNMEDHRDDLVVIFAGYVQEMSHFVETNPGLASRITKTIKFADYTTTELLQIADYETSRRQYAIADDARPILRNILGESRIEEHFGNARTVRNIVEKAIQAQASRLRRQANPISTLSDEELMTLTSADF